MRSYWKFRWSSLDLLDDCKGVNNQSCAIGDAALSALFFCSSTDL